MCEVCDLEQRLEHWLEHFNQQSTPCPTMTPPSRRQKRKRVGVGDEEYAVVNQMGRSDSKSRSLSIQNDYRGYSFQEQWSSSPSPPPRRDLETVDAASTTPHSFFRRFVSLRKPCILKGYDGISVDPNDLSRVAGKEIVQVEKRFSSKEAFGQNRTSSRQLLMSIDEFLNRLISTCHDLENGDDSTSTGLDEGELLYLSTQQSAPEEENGDDDPLPSSMAPFRTTPCRELLAAKLIPSTLPWAGNLKIESCNIWMGRSEVGSSSGLHHDFHDNFYLLMQGNKRFEIFSPDTAPHMKTFGSIEKIHLNGVISYHGSKTRADGTPVDLSMEAKFDDLTDESEVEEEEIILGKGYDYHGSSDEDDEIDFDAEGPDDYDKVFGKSNAPDEEEDDDEDIDNDEEEGDPTINTDKPDNGKSIADSSTVSKENNADRPNSFSKIDLENLEETEELRKKGCKKLEVPLARGDVLYLPAGFFHCVTSFSDQTSAPLSGKRGASSTPHLAINYWFHPPDRLDSFECPYKHPDELPR